MAANSDIRDWLREQGKTIGDKGRLKAEDIAAYEAAHPGEGPGEDDYPDAGGPESDSAASPEDRPRAARRSSRSVAGGWLSGGRKRSKARAPKARRTFPRVSLDRLIEHAWSDLAWAAGGLPPLQRMLEAQAPMAGMVLEDVIRDSAVDRALQPAARLEDKLDKAYGLIAPNLYVLLVLASAPAPNEPMSVAHKAAIMGLRHSLLVMARTGEASLEVIEKRGRDNARREADVDKFMRYLFGMPEPESETLEGRVLSDDEAMTEAARAAQDMYASAGVTPPG